MTTSFIADEPRDDRLRRMQAEKMARSSHAFVRGNTIDHYKWLADLRMPMPEGPTVWICGDCHVGNLGPIADIKGKVAIQIRDLDQTTFGNPAHDLIRLALSLASASRGSNLPGSVTARMIEEMVIGYEAGLEILDDNKKSPIREPDVVATVRREALGRKWHHLAEERIVDVRPKIPLGKKFWSLSDEEKWHLGVLLDSAPVKNLVLAITKRSKEARVELVDAAYWVKGCSSLGKVRYAALVHVSGERRDKLSLIDVKEAVPSAAPAAPSAVLPSHHGERVVEGARALSPHLGDRMAWGTISERPVIVRELLPEDLKLEMEQFTRRDAVGAARYLSSVVGKAHGRQMSPELRKSWLKELKGRHPPDLAAPTWLWNAVVALLVRHEEAYLRHCRTALADSP